MKVIKENDIIEVCDKKYKIIKLLGHGKGGYSYLASVVENTANCENKEKDTSENQCAENKMVQKQCCGADKKVVLKQIHHEPCSYYNFGNKIEAEKHDYERLLRASIRIPKMIAIDMKNERIIKEFIDGPTVLELVKNDYEKIDCELLPQVRAMARLAQEAGLNIDYFPTNFVLQNGLLYYIDYECNTYMEEWNFESWGIKYWSKTQEFMNYINNNF